MQLGLKKYRYSGFSLTEVLIGTAIISLVTMGVLSLTQYVYKNTGHIQTSLEFNTLVNLIQSSINNSTVCTNALNSIQLPPPPNSGSPTLTNPVLVPSLSTTNNGVTTVIAKSNWDYGSPARIHIDRIIFIDMRSAPGLNKYFSTLRVEGIRKQSGGTAASNYIKHDYPMIVTIDPANSNKITTCNGVDQNIWQVADNGSDIFYSNGMVGIGTTSPKQKLEIYQGSISSSQDNGWNAHSTSAFSNIPFHHSAFISMRGRGRQDAPSYPLVGDYLGGLVIRDAKDGWTGITNYGGASVLGIATENMNEDRKGVALEFATTSNGAKLPEIRMKIDQNGYVGVGSTNPQYLFTVGGGLEGNSFGISQAGDIIFTGGVDQNWALFRGNSNGSITGIMGVNSLNQVVFECADNGVSSDNACIQSKASFLIGADEGSFAADGFGPKLLIGGQSSNNTDPLYFQRNNFDVDRSELRLIIGDNSAEGPIADRFTIGALNSAAGFVWVPRTTFLSSGELGIGTTAPKTKLDVAGAIKPGTENQAIDCNADVEGSQRYNKAIHRMEYCGYNEGPPVTYAWQPMGGVSALTPVTSVMHFNSPSDTSLGKHKFCFLVNVTAIHQIQACGCSVDSDASSNWNLHASADPSVRGYCDCGARCVD